MKTYTYILILVIATALEFPVNACRFTTPEMEFPEGTAFNAAIARPPSKKKIIAAGLEASLSSAHLRKPLDRLSSCSGHCAWTSDAIQQYRKALSQNAKHWTQYAIVTSTPYFMCYLQMQTLNPPE